MSKPNDGLVGTLDRLGVARLAASQGLPPAIAERIAAVVVGTGLPEDRRVEVFRELVAHFQDGLDSGRTPEELLTAFGGPRETATLIKRAKLVVTTEELGGTGRGDGWPVLLWQDFRYAVRRLKARPAFTGLAVLSLALGIGANTAMFTLVNDVILRRPKAEAVHELVNLYVTTSEFAFNAFSYPEYRELTRATDNVFTGVAATKLDFVSWDRGERPERLMAEEVTGNYFDLLGIRTTRGRLIGPADASAPGQSPVVVLGGKFWRNAFGADPNVIGQTIRFAGSPYTVIGVAPDDFTGSLRGLMPDVYLPISMATTVSLGSGDLFDDWRQHSLFVKARLARGASATGARAVLGSLMQSIKERHLGDWRPEREGTFTEIPTSDVILYPPIDRLLVPIAAMLFAAVGMVLVIACANLAGFLLARAIDRKKEIGIRLALGASRGRLITQLVVETMVLSLLGGVLGLLFGRVALLGILASDLPLPVPLNLELPLDWRVASFAAVVSILTGVLFGLAPALQATRVDLAGTLRDEAAGGSRHKGWLRNVLVGSQVTVATVLLVMAGLFLRSLQAIRGVDPGFGKAPAALAEIGIPPNNPRSPLATVELIERKVAETPGISAVGAIDNLHLNTLNTTGTVIQVDGIEPPKGEQGHSVDRAAIDTGFIAAGGLRLLAGRNFTAADRDSAPLVAIVNAALANRFWPGRNAVGQHYRTLNGRQVEVVGVVNTAKIRNIAEEPRPALYQPLAQNSQPVVWLTVKTSGDANAVLHQVITTIRATDPTVFIVMTRTMQQHLDTVMLPFQLGAEALAGFALLALVTASIGLYGAVSYAVARRSREVGIRLSLGANRGSVIRLLLWGGVRTVLAGAAIGLALALVLGRTLSALLFGVAGADILTLVGVGAVLVAVGCLAAYFPARRAGRIDPLAALRAD